MLVVADSSPLQYLVLIGQAEVLPALFGEIAIPDEVARELHHTKTPQPVRDFVASQPKWLRIQNPAHIDPIPGIDAGEQAAIALAKQLRAELLLIDDLDGRRAAQARGITVTGTLGVLDRAAAHGLLDLHQAIDRLQATSIYHSRSLVSALSARHEHRRNDQR